MSNDWNDNGADGSVDPFAQTDWGTPAIDAQQPRQPSYAPPPPAAPLVPLTWEQSVEEGRAFALLSHVGNLIGLPLFLVPMFARDNAFALHHAKAAATTYLSVMMFIVGIFIMSYCTCGVSVLLLPLAWVPVAVGLVNAVNGRHAHLLAFGEIGEKLFSGLQVKGEPPQLPPG